MAELSGALLEQWFSDLKVHHTQPESLFLRICIFNKFGSDAAAGVWEPSFENHCLRGLAAEVPIMA